MTAAKDRRFATRGWLARAKRQKRAIELGGGWWILSFTRHDGTTDKIRLQGMSAIANWLDIHNQWNI